MTSRLPVLGSFDGRDPPSTQDVDECVHCGFCLPTCPTYVLWGQEMDSPRGRIHLVKVALEGTAPLDDVLGVHFDRCLGCMGCLTACPSGVRYDAILEATRAQLERNVRRPVRDKLFLAVLRRVLPFRRRLRASLVMGRWFRRRGLLRLLERVGVFKRWPTVGAASALLPSFIPPEPAKRPPTPGSGRANRGRRVGLLVGCVQSVLFESVHGATERVLRAFGYEVVRIATPQCCGALDLHTGRPDLARPRVRKLARALRRQRLEFLVTNAAGCGSALKTADRLFEPGSADHAAARQLAEHVRDAMELIEDPGSARPLSPIDARVAYHDACHLTHAQGLAEAPRRLLRAIPRLQLLEVEEGAICCGSAGIYNLTQPEAAAALGARKAGHLAATEPDFVAAANPGCALQIRAYLPDVPVVHPIELFDRALGGGPD